MNHLATVWPLAWRSLRRRRWRCLLTAALLGLAISTYMLYATFALETRGQRLDLTVADDLPCDVIYLGRDALSGEELADWQDRPGVNDLAAGHVADYHSAHGRLTVLALPGDSPLWAASGAAPPGPGQLLWPPGLEPDPGPGAVVALIPPDDPHDRRAMTVGGVHGGKDAFTLDVALTVAPADGPAPNAMFFWTKNQGVAGYLAGRLRSRYVVPSRPLLKTVDDPVIRWRGEAAAMAHGVLNRTFLPGLGAMTLVFACCVVGLFTQATMGFLDRRRELAILKTVGCESQGVLAMGVIEHGAVTVVGLGFAVSLVFLALPRLGGVLPGAPTGPAAAVLVKGIVAGLAVQFLGVLPAVMAARVATVNQLMFGLPIPLFYRRVYREELNTWTNV